MKRAAEIVRWGLAPAFCLVVFWPGLMAWFQLDDFAWLGLKRDVHNLGDFFEALFAPMAQGAVRPLSERAFFLVGEFVLGPRALPFRLVVFLTQVGGLTLLNAVAFRITGSKLAATLAPVFWTANVALALPMSWTSAYNQVLCAFLLLAALWLLMRHLETGERRFWFGQWAAFLLALGALETAAVYPALAAAYLALRAPKLVRKTIPMFLVSGAYAAAHFWLSRGVVDPAYAIRVDGRLPETFATYWQWALGAARLPSFVPHLVPAWAAAALTAVFTIGLVGFTFWKTRRGDRLALFPWVWFLLLLAPFLFMPGHLQDYYLAAPVAGLAMLAAWGVAAALRLNWSWKAVGAVAGALFLVVGAYEARVGSEILTARSLRVRGLIWGIGRARTANPGKAILLAGIDTPFFWAALAHRPFRFLGVPDIYLTPETAAQINAPPERLAEYLLPAPLAIRRLAQSQAVVYEVEPDRLRSVTLTYYMARKLAWAGEEPSRVDVGKPSFAGQLGPVWHNIHDGHRWMAKRATVRLAGPRLAKEKLHITGWCPAGLVRLGPLGVSFALDGRPLGRFTLSQGDAPFELVLPLPPEAIGRTRVDLSIEVDRTISPQPDLRELGLVFGTFEIRE